MTSPSKDSIFNNASGTTHDLQRRVMDSGLGAHKRSLRATLLGGHREPGNPKQRLERAFIRLIVATVSAVSAACGNAMNPITPSITGSLFDPARFDQKNRGEIRIWRFTYFAVIPDSQLPPSATPALLRHTSVRWPAVVVAWLLYLVWWGTRCVTDPSWTACTSVYVYRKRRYRLTSVSRGSVW